MAAVLSKGWITSPYCANGHCAGAGAGEMFPARWLGLNDVMYTHQCNVVENNKFSAWTRHDLPTWMSKAYVVYRIGSST